MPLPPTLREIARAAGVDISTVSRVLAGKARASRIGEATVRRVQDAASELGFRPNLTARALRTKRTNTIGLLVSDLVNPFFAAIAGAVEAHASSVGYTMMVATSGERLERQHEYIETFLSRQVDGLIVAPAPGSTARDRSFAPILAEEIPLVLLDRLVEGVDTSHVVADNRGAAARLVQELAARGARRLALASGPAEAWSMAERLAGFRKGLKAQRLPYDEELVRHGPFSVESGRLAAQALLAMPRPPDAIVAGNNRILTGVLEVLGGAGAAGARIAVAGFDGVPLAHLLGRPLVIAEQPVEEIGRQAARIVVAALEDDAAAPERLALPLRIVTTHTR